MARDRLGEKPLYYASSRAGFAFASEPKALRYCEWINFAMDADALRQYVRVGYIASPRTAWQGINKLPAASILVISGSNADPIPTRYWSLPAPSSLDSSTSSTRDRDDERADSLELLLEQSVRHQMIADVPLGAFLSGGIDSSLIVALMQRNTNRAIRTFSMGWGSSADDELASARRVASHLGTDHTELIVTPQDALATVPSLSSVYDEPFADASQIPTLLLSKLTRQHVTVALSGDAGDELFGGYNRYLTAVRLAPLMNRVPWRLRKVIGGAMRSVPAAAWDGAAWAARRSGLRVPQSWSEKVARLAQFVAAPSAADAYQSVVSQWTVDDAMPLLQEATPLLLEHDFDDEMPQQMMRWDLKTYLPDDILVKVDRAAMAHSLETRAPFLDHRVVEFAVSAPLRDKIRNGKTKWLLRKLLSRHFPENWFDRPKQGFTVPLDSWLRGPLRSWADDLLSPADLARSGLLDVVQVRRIWKEHSSGRRNHQRALWTVLMLQAWMHAQSEFVATQ